MRRGRWAFRNLAWIWVPGERVERGGCFSGIAVGEFVCRRG